MSQISAAIVSEDQSATASWASGGESTHSLVYLNRRHQLIGEARKCPMPNAGYEITIWLLSEENKPEEKETLPVFMQGYWRPGDTETEESFSSHLSPEQTLQNINSAVRWLSSRPSGSIKVRIKKENQQENIEISWYREGQQEEFPKESGEKQRETPERTLH